MNLIMQLDFEDVGNRIPVVGVLLNRKIVLKRQGKKNSITKSEVKRFIDHSPFSIHELSLLLFTKCEL